MLDAYAGSLDIALRHRRWILGLAFITFGLTAWLVSVSPKGFFPEEDLGQIQVITDRLKDAPDDLDALAHRGYLYLIINEEYESGQDDYDAIIKIAPKSKATTFGITPLALARGRRLVEGRVEETARRRRGEPERMLGIDILEHELVDVEAGQPGDELRRVRRAGPDHGHLLTGRDVGAAQRIRLRKTPGFSLVVAALVLRERQTVG